MRMDVDIVLSLADIIDQNGLPRLRCLSDDPFAQADTDTLGLRRMADLETHPQIIGAVIQQHDGKDAVVNDCAHKVSRALHQRLKMERGVQRISQPDEEFRLERLDAQLHLRRARLRSRPIVTLKVRAALSVLRDVGSGALLRRCVLGYGSLLLFAHAAPVRLMGHTNSERAMISRPAVLCVEWRWVPRIVP